MKKLLWTAEERENVQEILANETWIQISGQDDSDFLLESLLSNTTISEIVFLDIFTMDIDQITELLSTNKCLKSVEFVDCEYLDELFYDLDWESLSITDLLLDRSYVDENFKVISKCKSLKNLVIKGSFVPFADLKYVIANSQIESLSIEANEMPLKLLKEITDEILVCNRIVSLNISETCNSVGVIESIGKLLSSRIQKLKAGPFRLESKAGKNSNANLVKLAKKFKKSKLKSLSLYGVPLTDQFFLNIGPGFDQLSKLRLDSCEINDVTVPYLAEFVCKTIVELDFSRNKIGNHGLEILTNAMISNEHFHTLDITENEFDEDGFIHITRLLSESKLRRLILDGNHISKKAMEFLAKGMRKNKSMYSLYLEGCDYKIDDLQVLFESLYDHKYLFGVYMNKDVRDYPEAERAAELSKLTQQIGKLLKNNKNIRQLGCNLQRIVELVHIDDQLRMVEMEPEDEMQNILSCIQDNYSVTWIGEPNEYFYDDKKRYSDLGEYRGFVPITNRNSILQTKRAKEFFLSARKYLLLDLPGDLIYYMLNRSFLWALIHPRYQKDIVKCLMNKENVGKVLSNARFSPAVLHEVCCELNK
ncbi:hypothetical protein HK103_006787 [Boothiomyces macroporosus]|uniref:Uncharacterized protein n=1 Tax=Boothiomyces macroporosus TaxID=261099 RepID=A0AAD5UHB8_9FUNG|nr:hypothetical protein HK103_006787 [Boothiomyces macroporosus]